MEEVLSIYVQGRPVAFKGAYLELLENTDFNLKAEEFAITSGEDHGNMKLDVLTKEGKYFGTGYVYKYDTLDNDIIIAFKGVILKGELHKRATDNSANSRGSSFY